MRTIRCYTTYNFTKKDPVIDSLRTIVKASGFSYKEIHERSNVSVQTLVGWFDKKTRKPQNPTIEAVTRACGYKRAFVPLTNRETKAVALLIDRHLGKTKKK